MSFSAGATPKPAPTCMDEVFGKGKVERWFGLLTDKQIRRGVHKNVQALERDIRAWIADWNENPRPFVWTETADEILERLAGYLNRINDS
ncbi:ISMsm2, transposase [Streptomyces griseoflavus Tu4000]|uniref:ISMsm2, transposase n=1 Tax=Streptomyces griseoflavus Tu4000 TaxID=467200 RepID=D9Y292_9ACTN|nr:ISMsm2, transposase [Streptomyces griseoflavus Tu4000]